MRSLQIIPEYGSITEYYEDGTIMKYSLNMASYNGVFSKYGIAAKYSLNMTTNYEVFPKHGISMMISLHHSEV